MTDQRARLHTVPLVSPWATATAARWEARPFSRLCSALYFCSSFSKCLRISLAAMSVHENSCVTCGTGFSCVSCVAAWTAFSASTLRLLLVSRRIVYAPSSIVKLPVGIGLLPNRQGLLLLSGLRQRTRTASAARRCMKLVVLHLDLRMRLDRGHRAATLDAGPPLAGDRPPLVSAGLGISLAASGLHPGLLVGAAGATTPVTMACLLGLAFALG